MTDKFRLRAKLDPGIGCFNCKHMNYLDPPGETWCDYYEKSVEIELPESLSNEIIWKDRLICENYDR